LEAGATETSDEMLMLAYAGGDAGAFERLYRRHKDALYRYFLRHVEAADAGELYQDVWQKLIQARAGYRSDAPFAAWLYRIAHNRLVDHWRRLRPQDELSEDLAASEAQRPEVQAERADTARRLLDALARLPVEQREIIVLREERDLTLEQIAEIQGVGRETVKSRLRYALAKLRESFHD
jgi:RNA polymerase sigma-70 factor (ECF subfamily)